MKLAIFYLLSLIAISCTNNKIEYKNKVYENLKSIKKFNFNTHDHIIIIPGSGCPGCISEAEDFYIKNKNKNNLFFIFTNFSSIKSIKLKLGKDVINKNNTYIDQENVFLSDDNNENIYPLIFKLANDEFNYTYLDTHNDLYLKPN